MINYEELMGKVIDYPYKRDGEHIKLKALVAAVDPDIGITIVEEEDHERYLVCLIMPSSPQWIKGMNIKRAKATFDCVADMIVNNSYDDGEILKVYRKFSTENQKSIQDLFGEISGGNPTVDTCAF